MKTIQYLDAICVRYGVSDYKAAQLLGITRSAVSRYRNGLGTFDDDVSIKVATLLDLKPEKILLDMHAERSKDDQVRAVWERMAKRVAAVAGAAILSVGMMSGPVDSSTSEPTQAKATTSECILCKILALLLRRLAGALALALAGALASPAHADPLWDGDGLTGAGRWELVYQAVAAVDWMQTRYIAQHPDQFYEVNPIIGRNPSVSDVDVWFLAAGLAHAAISHYLPERYARPWQLGSIGFELALVWRNDRLGIGLSVPL